jgi:hypothetical protein
MYRSTLLVIILSAFLIAPSLADGAFLYKSYTIRYDRGWDILCDPYVVKKHDWVLKLFKQKGEIAHKDFPEFLRIFKRINPHIRDINRIRPGQHIMIPLRKLRPGTMPGQSTGIVTIPFVTISSLPKTVKTHSPRYEVRKGDTVSVLVARGFGRYGSQPYKDGVKLFRLVNPDIPDLDRIYVGQMIRIPDPAIRSQPWYASLFGPALARGREGGRGRSVYTEAGPTSPGPYDGRDTWPSPLEEAAAILNAKLYNKGVYWFPGKGREDLKLDLSRIPLMELKDGTKIVFPQEVDSQGPALTSIRSSQKNVKIVQLSPDTSAEQIFKSVFKLLGIDPLTGRLFFSDSGVEVEARGKWIIAEPYTKDRTDRKICISLIDHTGQRTPESIARYLEQHDIVIKDVLTEKGSASSPLPGMARIASGNVITLDTSDHRSLVNGLLTAMGYRYAPNVSITFPYADIQVKAVSNLVTKRNGGLLLIDFGDLYGDSIDAIEKTGFDIIQVTGEDGLDTIIRKLLDALGLAYANNPTFWAANRPAANNTALTIPGFLIAEAEGPKVLLADAPLHDGVIQLLKDKGVNVIIFEMPGKYS